MVRSHTIPKPEAPAAAAAASHVKPPIRHDHAESAGNKKQQRRQSLLDALHLRPPARPFARAEPVDGQPPRKEPPSHHARMTQRRLRMLLIQRHGKAGINHALPISEDAELRLVKAVAKRVTGVDLPVSKAAADIIVRTALGRFSREVLPAVNQTILHSLPLNIQQDPERLQDRFLAKQITAGHLQAAIGATPGFLEALSTDPAYLEKEARRREQHRREVDRAALKATIAKLSEDDAKGKGLPPKKQWLLCESIKAQIRTYTRPADERELARCQAALANVERDTKLFRPVPAQVKGEIAELEAEQPGLLEAYEGALPLYQEALESYHQWEERRKQMKAEGNNHSEDAIKEVRETFNLAKEQLAQTKLVASDWERKLNVCEGKLQRARERQAKLPAQQAELKARLARCTERLAEAGKRLEEDDAEWKRVRHMQIGIEAVIEREKRAKEVAQEDQGRLEEDEAAANDEEEEAAPQEEADDDDSPQPMEIDGEEE